MSRLEASNGVDSVESGRAKQPVVDSDAIDSRLPLGQTAETDTAGCVGLARRQSRFERGQIRTNNSVVGVDVLLCEEITYSIKMVANSVGQ